MKTKDLLTITSVAAGTAVLTVVSFWSGPTIAGSEAETLPAKIETPKLVANGVEFTLLNLEGRGFKAGDQPRFELRAVNPGVQPTAVAVRISMTQMAPSDMISRVARPQSFVWQEDRNFTLKPNETQTVAVMPNARLQTNNLVSMWIQEIVHTPSDNHPGLSKPQGPRVLAVSFPTGRNVWPLAGMPDSKRAVGLN